MSASERATELLREARKRYHTAANRARHISENTLLGDFMVKLDDLTMDYALKVGWQGAAEDLTSVEAGEDEDLLVAAVEQLDRASITRLLSQLTTAEIRELGERAQPLGLVRLRRRVEEIVARALVQIASQPSQTRCSPKLNTPKCP